MDALDFGPATSPRPASRLDQPQEETPGVDRRDHAPRPAGYRSPLAIAATARPPVRPRVFLRPGPSRSGLCRRASSGSGTRASTVAREPPAGRIAGEPWLAARNERAGTGAGNLGRLLRMRRPVVERTAQPVVWEGGVGKEAVAGESRDSISPAHPRSRGWRRPERARARGSAAGPSLGLTEHAPWSRGRPVGEETGNARPPPEPTHVGQTLDRAVEQVPERQAGCRRRMARRGYSSRSWKSRPKRVSSSRSAATPLPRMPPCS